MWLHSLKVAQLLRSAACLHTNQSRSYLNHLVYRSFQEHESLTLHDFLSTGHHLLVVSFITSLKSNICTALTTWNTAVNNCIILHAQNTTALQTCIFELEYTNQSLFTSEGQPVFRNAGHCQCQLQTSQSLICGNKMPTRCNRGFYCRSYCLLNMFRA